jgi:hypothetical protein
MKPPPSTILFGFSKHEATGDERSPIEIHFRDIAILLRRF